MATSQMRVIVAGSRTITDPAIVARAIDQAVLLWGRRPSELLSGCAAGPDTLALTWAIRHQVLVRRFPADWSRHGRGAGPLRNESMAATADALVAVWDGQSRGTADMIRRAKAHGLLIFIDERTPA